MMKVTSVESADKLLILHSDERTRDFADRILNEIDRRGECLIDVVKPKRSLSANAYMWKLCSEIGRKLRKSKDEIYKKAIRDVGKYDSILIFGEAVPDFQKRWDNNGLGWFVERSYTRGDFVALNAYYGTSVYDSKEMATLIDYLVADAEELGIPTVSPEERESMIKEWGLKK